MLTTSQAPTYMEEPEGYKTDQGKVCHVTKALYGTMDGATNWFEALDEEMSELGYYQSKADPSVCSRHADSKVTITSTYTDDVMGISSTTAGAKLAREELGWKYKVKDLGEVNLVLGIHIDHDRDAGTIIISQHAYLERVLTHYGMTECNPQPTPLSLSVELTKGQAPLTEADRHFMKNKSYQEVLSSVMYGYEARPFICCLNPQQVQLKPRQIALDGTYARSAVHQGHTGLQDHLRRVRKNLTYALWVRRRQLQW
jgi:Reverse transcriptase (RNA-dependent DNA polymerase)